MEKMTLGQLYRLSRDTLDSYYKTRSAHDFFKIDDILSLCRKCNLTIEDMPTLIEMQNVIVMG